MEHHEIEHPAPHPAPKRLATPSFAIAEFGIELLDQRIGRVEEGIERPDCTLASLLMRRESLKHDMESQYRRLAS